MPEERQNTATDPQSIIATWTKDDYLIGTAPYEWVYALKDNTFMHRRMKTLVAEAARAVKVGNFISLYNGYEETQNKALGIIVATSLTAFDGQPLTLTCGQYHCDDSGIYTESRYGEDIKVCSHPIMPVKRLCNIDTGEIKLEIAFSRGKRWQRVIFDKQILSSAQKITQLASYGIGVDSESAKHLVAYISAMENMNYDALPEANSVGRLGWMDEYGFAPYVENILFDGHEGYQHMFGKVKGVGSWEKWLSLAKAVREGKSIVARCALAASFASVLVRPLDALPFIVHLWGGAGAGKTVGLMLAASVWASPNMGDYIKSFNGTPVANELHAGFCGSLPLCLDELQCIKDKKSFDDIIYMLCEGTGKARGAKGGGLQRMSVWRNCTISTGEMPITTGNSGAGAINRVLEINCGDEKLFEDPRGAVSLMTKNYGHAGKRFVNALQADDSVMDTVRSIQQSYYEQLEGKATDKQSLAASILLAADAVSEMLLFEDGISLKVDDILPFLATKDAADANKRAYDWLCDWVAANPQRFAVNNFGDYTGECWGEVEEKGTVVFIIKGIFDRAMTDAGFSGAAFLSWAKRKNLVQTQGKHNTKVKRLKGLKSLARCVCLQLPGEYEVETDTGNTIIYEQTDIDQVFGGS